MIVISNASPLIALSQAGVLHILRDLFQSVLIPDAVYHETVIWCHIITQKSAIERGIGDFLQVASPSFRRSFSRNLGSGETGVLDLALEHHADLLLMDDKKARNEAKSLDLPCAFTSDVLRYADDFGLIDFQTVVDKLHSADIYLPGV